MPSYKRMENRKYNEDEIKYVLSRVHAGWDDVTIARAFKKDHVKYWGNRDFTKKQAAYIRSSYKMPWGTVKPYKGPIPRFSESPEASAFSGPNMTAQQQRPQASGATANNTGTQAQNFAFGQANMVQDTNEMSFDSLFLQPNGGSAEDPLDVDAYAAGPAPEDSKFFDFSKFDQDPFNLPDLNPMDDALQGLNANQQAVGASNGNQRLDPIQAQLCEPITDISGLMGFDAGTAPEYGADFGMDLANGFGQNPIDILAQVPNQPGEQLQQQQQKLQQLQPASAGAQGLQTFQSPRPVHSIEVAQPASETQIPPGYTAEDAILRDPQGVWYYGAHDQCQIARTHRHDTDGGVYFTSELGVYQTFIDMQKQEGVGFLLGMATAQMVQGSDHPLNGWQGAAEIARGTLLEEDGSEAQAGVVEAPKPEIAERLAQINRQLPQDHYYEPFTNRIVQYTLPRRHALRNGDQSNGAAAGGPAQ